MKNKTRVRNSKRDYNKWLTDIGGKDDPEGLEEISEMSSPFAIEPTSPLRDDMYEVLEDLYYGGILKGKQRQIVSLLMDGVFNEQEIARRLNISRQAVVTYLKRIRKKLLQV